MPTDPAATLDYFQPGADGAGVRSRFSRVAMQVTHRGLSLALILLVVGTGAAAAGKAAAPLLLWAFAAGDVALLAAFLSLVSDRRRGLVGREASIAAAVAGAVAGVALVLYLLFRTRGA